MKIIVPKKITNKIIDKLINAGNYETKGALFAKQIDNDCFEIEDVYISKVNGTNFFSNLIINREYKRFEKRYFKKHKKDYLNHNYIGDWHSHPLFECIPSNYDKNELADELHNSNANFLIQLIVKLADNLLIGKCYYCNKNEIIMECELEIIN